MPFPDSRLLPNILDSNIRIISIEPIGVNCDGEVVDATNPDTYLILFKVEFEITAGTIAAIEWLATNGVNYWGIWSNPYSGIFLGVPSFNNPNKTKRFVKTPLTGSYICEPSKSRYLPSREQIKEVINRIA